MSSSVVLTVMRDGVVQKTHSFQGEALLGRAEGCAIRIQDRSISRHHALFRSTGNSVQVQNKSEFAPLVVNGVECSEAVLKEGDVLIVGPFMVRVSFSKLQAQDQVQSKVLPTSGVDSASLQVLDTGLISGVESIAELKPFGADEFGGMGPSMNTLQTQDLKPLSQLSQDGQLQQQNEIEQQGFSDGASELSPKLLLDSKEVEEVSQPFDRVEDDGKTKIGAVTKIIVKLIFPHGLANVDVYELNKDLVSIGRGKDCDIVLNDKKASRKNTVITRLGSQFFVKDLDSVNGTFVNGVKIKDKELEGDDLIKVGGVEFQFKAMSADYAAQEKEFISVPAVVESVEEESSRNLDFSVELPPAEQPGEIGLAQNLGVQESFSAPQVPLDASMGGIPGITGITSSSSGRGSLLEKFRVLPKRTQYIVIVALILLGSWLMEEDEPSVGKKKDTQSKKPTPIVSPAISVVATFDSIPAEKRQFIESQHSIAFDYYKNKEYDKALFEIEKIFSIIPEYKDSREIQRYAREGKRKMDVLEEERRKKEEEDKLRGKIAQLVEQTRQKMEKKLYDQAQEMFPEILAIDPDNGSVTKWKKEIEAIEEAARIKEQQRQVQEDIDKRAWLFYQEGLNLKHTKKYHSAITQFEKVLGIETTDKKLPIIAKNEIASCHRAIKNLREPILLEAKQMESSGEYAKAFSLYKKVIHIDSSNSEGHLGVTRVRGILHDRAKIIYTEAILAESYSDFVMAKKMFQECIVIAPEDDIYYERAQRKLAHYFQKDETSPK